MLAIKGPMLHDFRLGSGLRTWHCIRTFGGQMMCICCQRWELHQRDTFNLVY